MTWRGEWRPRILDKLNKVIAKGNTLNFIENFLKRRTFQVKTSKTLSDTFVQENGVPQGSTIYVILFLIAINDISEELTLPTYPYYTQTTSLSSAAVQTSIQSNRYFKIPRINSYSGQKPLVFICPRKKPAL